MSNYNTYHSFLQCFLDGVLQTESKEVYQICKHIVDNYFSPTNNRVYLKRFVKPKQVQKKLGYNIKTIEKAIKLFTDTSRNGVFNLFFGYGEKYKLMMLTAQNWLINSLENSEELQDYISSEIEAFCSNRKTFYINGKMYKREGGK